eukprot:COSAG04_NODE_6_length_47123_cov_87.347482_4_plen_428_part_00
MSASVRMMRARHEPGTLMRDPPAGTQEGRQCKFWLLPTQEREQHNRRDAADGAGYSGTHDRRHMRNGRMIPTPAEEVEWVRRQVDDSERLWSANVPDKQRRAFRGKRTEMFVDGTVVKRAHLRRLRDDRRWVEQKDLMGHREVANEDLAAVQSLSPSPQTFAHVDLPTGKRIYIPLKPGEDASAIKNCSLDQINATRKTCKAGADAAAAAEAVQKRRRAAAKVKAAVRMAGAGAERPHSLPALLEAAGGGPAPAEPSPSQEEKKEQEQRQRSRRSAVSAEPLRPGEDKEPPVKPEEEPRTSSVQFVGEDVKVVIPPLQLPLRPEPEAKAAPRSEPQAENSGAEMDSDNPYWREQQLMEAAIADAKRSKEATSQQSGEGEAGGEVKRPKKIAKPKRKKREPEPQPEPEEAKAGGGVPWRSVPAPPSPT